MKIFITAVLALLVVAAPVVLAKDQAHEFYDELRNGGTG